MRAQDIEQNLALITASLEERKEHLKKLQDEITVLESEESTTRVILEIVRKAEEEFEQRTKISFSSIDLSEDNAVHYGSTIRLKHITTGCMLHSHPEKYNTGSYQQEVTCYHHRDANDYWVLKSAHNTKKQGIILNGHIIRLTHQQTGANLHSHSGHGSPSSGQQEVTGYGSTGVGDENDNWRIEFVDGSRKVLRAGDNFRLIHVATEVALHSHAGHSTYVTGQQEVTGYSGRDDNDLWCVDTVLSS